MVHVSLTAMPSVVTGKPTLDSRGGGNNVVIDKSGRGVAMPAYVRTSTNPTLKDSRRSTPRALIVKIPSVATRTP